MREQEGGNGVAAVCGSGDDVSCYCAFLEVLHGQGDQLVWDAAHVSLLRICGISWAVSRSPRADDETLSRFLHIGILPGVTCLGCKAASLQAEREELHLLCAGCSQLYFHIFYAMLGLGSAQCFHGCLWSVLGAVFLHPSLCWWHESNCTPVLSSPVLQESGVCNPAGIALV